MPPGFIPSNELLSLGYSRLVEETVVIEQKLCSIHLFSTTKCSSRHTTLRWLGLGARPFWTYPDRCPVKGGGAPKNIKSTTSDLRSLGATVLSLTLRPCFDFQVCTASMMERLPTIMVKVAR